MSCCAQTTPARIAELATMIDRLNRGAAERTDRAEADNLLICAATLMHELRKLVNELAGESYPRPSVRYSDGRFHLPGGVPDYVTNGEAS